MMLRVLICSLFITGSIMQGEVIAPKVKNALERELATADYAVVQVVAYDHAAARSDALEKLENRFDKVSDAYAGEGGTFIKINSQKSAQIRKLLERIFGVEQLNTALGSNHSFVFLFDEGGLVYEDAALTQPALLTSDFTQKALIKFIEKYLGVAEGQQDPSKESVQTGGVRFVEQPTVRYAPASSYSYTPTVRYVSRPYRRYYRRRWGGPRFGIGFGFGPGWGWGRHWGGFGGFGLGFGPGLWW